jgi:hypothetical protein
MAGLDGSMLRSDPWGRDVMTCHSKQSELTADTTLVELCSLINEQFRLLQGRLSDADLSLCNSRAEEIRQLLEAARHSSSQPLLSPKLPTTG